MGKVTAPETVGMGKANDSRDSQSTKRLMLIGMAVGAKEVVAPHGNPMRRGMGRTGGIYEKERT